MVLMFALFLNGDCFAQNIEARDILSAGGSTGQSASYKIHDTIGQIPIGPAAAGAAKIIDDGFWFFGLQENTSWTMELSVNDGAIFQDRYFGVHHLGTDVYDSGLDEIIPPPGFAFYSYFRGVLPFSYLSKDIKSSEPDTTTWLLTVMNATTFTVEWDPLTLPVGFKMFINGVDMSEVTFIDRQFDQTLSILAYHVPLTADEEDERVPAYALHSCFPNPFNPTTTIVYDLPEQSRVNLRIYDVTGRLVRVLIGGIETGIGRHQICWDGKNNNGRIVASGVYFCRLTTGSYRKTKRMVLLK